MRADLTEYSDSSGFSLSLTAETVEEAALLIRFGMNASPERPRLVASANRDGSIDAWVGFIGKKRVCSNVAPGRY